MILTRLQAEKLIDYLDTSLHISNPKTDMLYINVAYKIMEYADNNGGIDYNQAVMLISELDKRFRVNSPSFKLMYLYITNAIMDIANNSATRWGIN